MSAEEMLALIPTQSGIYFCDCPNCDLGRQEGQFKSDPRAEYQAWSVEAPDQMRCSHCGHVYPSETWPMNDAVEVLNPRGETQSYPYYKDADGYGHHFAARIDYHKIRYMERAANTFARLYAITEDEQYARRAMLIMHRFAKVYAGYCYHFDYPFREKIIYSGDVAPADFRSGFRTARWTWWAFMDVPSLLVEAWDLIATSDQEEDVSADIEDFLASAAEQVMANRDNLGNMSPGMWASLIRVGRVIGEPEYVHTAMERLRRFMADRFFYDGVWMEGAPSYHSQVIGNLSIVFTAAKGYSDPPGYSHPETGERFDELDIETDFPLAARSRAALMQMRLPNGRLVPVHDTWSTNRRSALDESGPWLLPGLGHACLGRGTGDEQLQAHLTWSGGYGHRHYDGLSLLLFAGGREMLSDLGYTHTKVRAWTIATASHNVVVVDHKSQVAGGGAKSTYGSLRYFDAAGDFCQVVSVDNPEVYPDDVSLFRRTLILADRYLVDLFQVSGGDQHDYFLHGSADEPQELTSTPEAQPADVESLVPEGVDFEPGKSEADSGKATHDGWPYGYLTDLRACPIEGPEVVTLRYAYPDEEAGLIAHLLAEPGDEVMLGTNPAVRPAREDDGEVDAYHRVFAMVRRSGGQSVFATVIEPVSSAAEIAAVVPLTLPGATRAIEIQLESGRRDLVLLEPASVETQWQGETVTASAELVVLSRDADGASRAVVVAGTIRWGEIALDALVAEHPLVDVDADAQTLVVEGSFALPPGATITLDHAGGRVSAYTVVGATPEGDRTRIEVAAGPGFDWDAVEQTSTFTCVPHTSYTGAHTVRLRTVARSGL